jgi:hypothetical protein
MKNLKRMLRSFITVNDFIVKKSRAEYRAFSLSLLVLIFAAMPARAQLLIPFTGSTSLACGTNTLVQDHAGSSQYANNASGYIVLDAGFGAAISIVGTYTTETGWDYVRIFNGVGTGGTMLLNVSGTGNINFTGTAGQTLTLQFFTDGSVVMDGLNLNVSYSGPCFATPCSGIPPPNSVITPTFVMCPNSSTTMLSLANTYTVGGLTFQWQSSTTSSVGPYTAITSATNTSYLTPNASTSTWYQVSVTCTNSGGSTTVTVPGQVMISSGVITNNVPYYEDFEQIGQNDRLPNCSWTASGMLSTTRTYTTSASGNRIPRSGTSFASFVASPVGTKYFYTNGIWLEPGITYSAGVWFTSDLTGAINWTNFGLLLGTSQSTVGLTPIALQAGSAMSPVYKSVSNTFTVSAPAFYYVAVRATSGTGSAAYLSWDDLSITIPCTSVHNPISVSMTANSTTVCEGAIINLSATGADTYTWSTGANSQSINEIAVFTTNYSVQGTNTLTGCQDGASITVKVDPAPVISSMAYPPVVCAGNPVTLMASGASTYQWNTGSTGAVITAMPTFNTTYAVVGTATNGCSATTTVAVTVNSLPSVVAMASPQSICRNENITLTGGGAVTYKWTSSSSAVVLSGSPITFAPSNSSMFTVTGTDANGCENTANISVAVEECTGINALSVKDGLSVYPNPTSGHLMVEFNSEEGGSVKLADVSGRIIMQDQTGENQMALNLENYASGIYYLTVISGEKTGVIKIVKQ